MRIVNAAQGMLGMEDRRAEVGRIEAMSGQEIRTFGFVEVEGSGELVFDVVFPVRYLERPFFSFGAELMPNQGIVTGSYPTVSQIVKSWTKFVAADGVTEYYTGATIVAVLMGHAEIRSILHWQVLAMAIMNPNNDVGDSGGTA